MNYLHVILLAVIQATAELLPVSSSAHVILVEHWLGLDPSSPEMVFLLVMLHTGTMGSVLYFFKNRWKPLLADGAKELFIKLMLATAATGVLGIILKKIVEHFILGGGEAEVEDLFRMRNAVGFALIAAGTLIFLSGIYSKAKGHLASQPLTRKAAVIIGLVQGLCLPFRGFSRSGATISAALGLRIKKDLAEDFSFLLAVIITPPVIVRSCYKLYKSVEKSGTSMDTLLHTVVAPGLTGAVVAFFAGIIALKFLSKMLETNRWYLFGLYCYFVAAVMISGV